MVFRGDSLKWVVVALTILHPVDRVSANCHFSFVDDYKLYDFSLDTPMPLYPHGVQSEDGFYKVVGNKTVIWFQGPYSLEKTGTCNYGTVLKHPSGCAKIVHVSGKGWGWFATFLIIVLCLFGVYLLAGAVYRYYSLGVRGIDIIPNLDFWTGLPQQAQSVSASLLHKFRGSSQGHRSVYSPVNF